MREETIEIHCPKCGASLFLVEREGVDEKILACSCGFETSGADLESLIDDHLRRAAQATVRKELDKIFSGLKGFKKL